MSTACPPPLNKGSGGRGRAGSNSLEAMLHNFFDARGRRHAPWYPLLEHFEVFFRYPESSYLFTQPGALPQGPRVCAGPTAWPYFILKTIKTDLDLPHLVELPPVEDSTVNDGPIEVPTGPGLTEDEEIYTRALVQNFKDVFTPGVSQTRTTLMHHRINTGDAAPIQARPYRLSRIEERVISEEVEKMLRAGVIVPSQSPWSSAPVLVTKPDGSVRFCIDYRPLNAVTVRDNFPMPRVDETLDAMAQGVKYLSKIDCKAAFWLIPVAAEDRAKTAFITKGGLYEFVSMPFGLKNAPATLQRFVTMLLRDVIGKYCVIYMDDCLIFSKTFKEHVAHIVEILKRFRAVGFRANPAKCELFAQRVLYLGHVLTPGGVLPNPAKVQAIMDAEPPTTATGVRSFLGLANYYRRYLPNMAAISAPLTQLTRKRAPFDWTPECDIAFQEIKRLLVQAPLLRYPNFDKQFILYTDWQPGAAAAILGQEDDEGEYVIAYASHSLSGAALNYSPTDGELFAVVWAIRLFRPYLYGTHFRLVTDHKALKWLLSTRNLTGKLARYAIELQEYDFDIQFRSGSIHANVDGLSRLAQPPQEEFPVAALLEDSGALMLFCEQQTSSEEDPVPPENSQYQTPPSLKSPTSPPGPSDEEPKEGGEPRVGDQDYLEEDEYVETQCCICNGLDDEERMLLCDTCDAGYHIDCLDPPLTGVPRVPWHCASCTEHRAPALPADITEDDSVLQFLAEGEPPQGASSVEAKRIRRRASNYYIDQVEHAAQPIDWATKQYTLMRKAVGIHPPRVVPWPEDRLDIIRGLHESLGHFGITRTYNLVKERYYWQGMYEQVLMYVKYCQICQQRTATACKTVEYTPVAVHGAFHTVGIDITGPFTSPRTREKKYIIVCIDYLTKWVEAQIIPDKTAITTAAFFRQEVIARHGCPAVLISDNGREWEGAFSDLINDSGIEHRHTSPHHPQANGLVERFNGTIKEKLKENVTLYPTRWVQRFPEVLLGYRSSIHSTTKYSPFQLLYGRQAVLPMENLKGVKRILDPEGAQPPHVEPLQDAALENIQRAQKRQKASFQESLANPTRKAQMAPSLEGIKEGDLLLIRNHKVTKGMVPFVGPFHFVRWHSKNSVILRNKLGKEWVEATRNLSLFRS